jgi:hypothetical protein
MARVAAPPVGPDGDAERRTWPAARAAHPRLQRGGELGAPDLDGGSSGNSRTGRTSSTGGDGSRKGEKGPSLRDRTWPDRNFPYLGVRWRLPNIARAIGRRVILTADRDAAGSRSDSDPSAFVMKITKQMQGDARLCSFYGAEKAVSILQVRFFYPGLVTVFYIGCTSIFRCVLMQ